MLFPHISAWPAQPKLTGNGSSAPGQEFVLPELIPGTSAALSVHRCKAQMGTALLSATVDAEGKPQRIAFSRALGDDRDKLALQIVEADRFKPALWRGSPIVAAVSIEVDLEACFLRKNKERDAEYDPANLKSQPVQRIDWVPEDLELQLGSAPDESANPSSVPAGAGDGVTAPKPLFTPAAQYSDYARRKRLQGVCIVGLIVDVHGMPQDVRVMKSLEPSLDQSAIEAVKKYRFKPAMKDGKTPVPVAVNVEVNFRLYEK
jgi:TonB family protein